MNTRYLLTLRQIAESGSVAAAARRLHLAPNSVNDQVRTLERELNVSLLTRSGRVMRLTTAGHAVASAAGAVLHGVDSLRQAARLDAAEGQLKVGVISTAMVTLLPDAVRRMRERFRGIELSIRPGTSIQLHRMLEMGEIDCAVMTHPPFPLAKTFFWRGLRVYPLALLGPEDRMQGGIEEILRREPFIRIDQNVWTGRLVTAFLAKRGWSVNSIIEMDGLEVILMLVGRGMGVTLMPDWGAGQYSEPRLRRIVVSDPAYRRETGLLGQRGPREGLIDAFLTTLVPSAP